MLEAFLGAIQDIPCSVAEEDLKRHVLTTSRRALAELARGDFAEQSAHVPEAPESGVVCLVEDDESEPGRTEPTQWTESVEDCVVDARGGSYRCMPGTASSRNLGTAARLLRTSRSAKVGLGTQSAGGIPHQNTHDSSIVIVAHLGGVITRWTLGR